MIKKDIYIFTNGHGEDDIAFSIIQELKDFSVHVFPLVGNGNLFRKNGIKVVYKGKNFSSGGLLVREGLLSIITDIKEGFFFDFLKILAKIKSLSLKDSLMLVVGDLYPVILLYLLTEKKSILVLSSKSIRIKPLSFLEIFVLKNMTEIIFVRDVETMVYLMKYGINSLYIGNPVIKVSSIDGRLSLFRDRKVILFLPGSRSDLYVNIFYMLKIIDSIANLRKIEGIVFLFHLSDSTSLDTMIRYLPEKWMIRNESPFPFLEKEYKDSGKLKVFLLKGCFFEAATLSSVVVGLSGTANERAVAMGKPVIAFPVPGTHATHERFTKRQIPLLGENIIYFPVFNSDKVAIKILDLLRDKNYLNFLKIRGKEKVGKSGIPSITAFLNTYFK